MVNQSDEDVLLGSIGCEDRPTKHRAALRKVPAVLERTVNAVERGLLRGSEGNFP